MMTMKTRPAFVPARSSPAATPPPAPLRCQRRQQHRQHLARAPWRRDRGAAGHRVVGHDAGAQKVGKTLRPTELLIFGNPQGGTPLMECAQSAGIDLPLKALVWEDAQGQSWLAQRHGAASCPVVENLKKALSGLADAAAT